jgi:hypothetical protein
MNEPISYPELNSYETGLKKSFNDDLLKVILSVLFIKDLNKKHKIYLRSIVKYFNSN